MLEDPNAVTHTLFGQEIAVNGYFTSVLGAPALNMASSWASSPVLWAA